MKLETLVHFDCTVVGTTRSGLELKLPKSKICFNNVYNNTMVRSNVIKPNINKIDRKEVLIRQSFNVN